MRYHKSGERVGCMLKLQTMSIPLRSFEPFVFVTSSTQHPCLSIRYWVLGLVVGKPSYVLLLAKNRIEVDGVMNSWCRQM